MRIRDRFAVALLAIALAVAAAGLVVNASKSDAPQAIANTALREGVVGHPSSINPLTARSQVDRDLVALLFRGLVREGKDGALVPDLASEWSVSDDSRTYTFQMRTDAYWEDGQPVTSADVVFTVGLIQNSKYDGVYGSSWQGIHATAEGPYAVKFAMTLPLAGFLREATLPILPKHLLSDVPVEKLADSSYSSRPIGDGPYRILDIDYTHALLGRVSGVNPATTPGPTSSTLRTPTPSPSRGTGPTPTPQEMGPGTSGATGSPGPGATYAPPPTPTPSPTAAPTPTPMATAPAGMRFKAVGEIDLIFYDDSASAAADFKAGNLDAAGGLDPDGLLEATDRPNSRAIGYQWANLEAIVLNQQSDDHPELRDVNIRTALLSVVNRDSMVRDVLYGHGIVADAPLPPWSWAYDTSSVNGTPYDQLAGELFLMESGWTRTSTGWAMPGEKVDYTLHLLTPDKAANQVLYASADSVAQSWRMVGLTVVLEAVPMKQYLSRLASGNFEEAIVDYTLGLDPDLSPLLLSSQYGSGGLNVSGIHDTQLDQMLLAARKAADPTARQAAMAVLEKYISTVLPILPLCFRDYDLVVSESVQSVVPTQIGDPSDRYWDVIDWRLANDR